MSRTGARGTRGRGVGTATSGYISRGCAHGSGTRKAEPHRRNSISSSQMTSPSPFPFLETHPWRSIQAPPHLASYASPAMRRQLCMQLRMQLLMQRWTQLCTQRCMQRCMQRWTQLCLEASAGALREEVVHDHLLVRRQLRATLGGHILPWVVENIHEPLGARFGKG